MALQSGESWLAKPGATTHLGDAPHSLPAAR